jgi:uncharacterized protein (TIGR03000 family)
MRRLFSSDRRYSPDLTVSPRSQAASITVEVPADAELWFAGTKTMQKGNVRQFVSPPLTPGKDFYYRILARWTDDGRTVEQTRTITVRAGEHLQVDFPGPQ